MLFILYIIVDANISESFETIGQEISLGNEFIYMYIVLVIYIYLRIWLYQYVAASYASE